jgi:hypothetical protein
MLGEHAYFDDGTDSFLGGPEGCPAVKINDTALKVGGYMTHVQADILANSIQKRAIDRADYAPKDYQVPRCPKTPVPNWQNILGEKTTSLFEYIDSRLSSLEKNVPIVVSILQGLSQLSKGSLDQTFSFACGMRRLSMDKTFVIVAGDADTLEMFQKKKHLMGDAHVLYHESFLPFAAKTAQEAGIVGPSKIMKLLVPAMLVDRGFDVLLSDVDVHFVVNPLNYLRALDADIAVMRGGCYSQPNTGFLYFRSTSNTKDILRTSLAIRKHNPAGITQRTDNDQWLLTCAATQAAYEGRGNVWFLPTYEFALGPFGFVNWKCHAAGEFRADDSKRPIVWHKLTGTRFQIKNTDVFEKLGMWDLGNDGDSCKEGLRGTPDDQILAAQRGFNSCRSIQHSGCCH